MRQRGENSWNLRVYAGRDAISGRKVSIERTVRGTKREASKALAGHGSRGRSAARANRREGQRWLSLRREWLEHAAPSFSSKTVETTRMYIEDPILPALGSVQVAKLTLSDLDRFYRQLLEVGRSTRSVRSGHHPTGTRHHPTGFGPGVRWGWIMHNPAVDASPPRVPMKGAPSHRIPAR